jgi:hypothetical protein
MYAAFLHAQGRLLYDIVIHPQHSPGGLLLSKCSLNGAKCSLNGAKCFLNGAKCSLNGAKCSLNGAKCSLNGAKCSLNGAKCSLMGSVLQTERPCFSVTSTANVFQR